MLIRLATFDEATYIEHDCHPAVDPRGVVIVDQFGRPWVFDQWLSVEYEGKLREAALFIGAVRWNAHIPQKASIEVDYRR